MKSDTELYNLFSALPQAFFELTQIAFAGDYVYNQIIDSTLAPDTKDRMVEVFMEWLANRFNTMTKKEVIAMVQFTTTFEETQFYKDIVMEGEIKGKIKGKIENLESLRDQNILTDEQFQSLVTPLRQELEKLNPS